LDSKMNSQIAENSASVWHFASCCIAGKSLKNAAAAFAAGATLCQKLPTRVRRGSRRISAVLPRRSRSRRRSTEMPAVHCYSDSMSRRRESAGLWLLEFCIDGQGICFVKYCAGQLKLTICV
jgi:hypothetical protein